MSIQMILTILNVLCFFAAAIAFHYGRFKAGLIFTAATIGLVQIRKLIADI